MDSNFELRHNKDMTNHHHEGTTSGSKCCEVCGEVKPGTVTDRRTGLLTCNDCYAASGRKAW